MFDKLDIFEKEERTWVSYCCVKTADWMSHMIFYMNSIITTIYSDGKLVISLYLLLILQLGLIQANQSIQTPLTHVVCHSSNPPSDNGNTKCNDFNPSKHSSTTPLTHHSVMSVCACVFFRCTICHMCCAVNVLLATLEVILIICWSAISK